MFETFNDLLTTVLAHDSVDEISIFASTMIWAGRGRVILSRKSYDRDVRDMEGLPMTLSKHSKLIRPRFVQSTRKLYHLL